MFLCGSAFVLALPAKLAQRDLLGNQVADDAEEDTGKDGEDYVGGVMYIQVHPGEGNCDGKDQGGNTQNRAVQQHHGGGPLTVMGKHF